MGLGHGEGEVFMKRLLGVFGIVLMISGLIAGCVGRQEPGKQNKREGKSAPTEITVSAAASLKDALTEIKLQYEGKKPGIKLVLNFGSSGTLQQQIEQGAPVDLFISAGKSQMVALEAKQLLAQDSRVNILGNELVLIVGKANHTVRSFADLNKPEVKHIAIGQPGSVPAGKYAKETLTALKLWDGLRSKFVEAKDVRQVLTYVETGDAEAGLVYKSDTILSERVKIAAVAPAGSHSPVVYPAAVIKASKNAAAAGELLKFLKSKEAQQVFSNYGFVELKPGQQL